MKIDFKDWIKLLLNSNKANQICQECDNSYTIFCNKVRNNNFITNLTNKEILLLQGVITLPDSSQSITHSSLIYDEFAWMNILPHEEMWAVYLNMQQQIIDKKKISNGGIASTLVDPRIIFKHAVLNSASFIMLVHNHPSGNVKPSKEDDRLTQKIREAALLLNMKLTDHVIIAGNSYFSYFDECKL